jgi:dUTP pyrophosphatase
LPAYQSPGAAGIDLQADIDAPMTLNPLQRVRVPTGFCFEIPPGYEGQVRPRSGLASKHGLTCLNSPGTIDSDYRGEVQVLLVNLSDTACTINPEERIAQLVICPVHQASFVLTSALSDTQRGSGGFGSTGA